jgi:signal transduction histidine kinase
VQVGQHWKPSFESPERERYSSVVDWISKRHVDELLPDRLGQGLVDSVERELLDGFSRHFSYVLDAAAPCELYRSGAGAEAPVEIAIRPRKRRSMGGVGNDIAHDLRTPLTRVRVGLERARQNARTLEDLRAAVDQAVGLGLSLVNAIVKLHGFRFSISPGPGCVAEIAGQRAHAGEKGSAHGSDEQI